MENSWLTYLFFGLIGLALGSFGNVVADRLTAGLSLVRPGSACPACGRRLKPWELIPVLSFFLLRGRCRTCGAPIGWRTPVLEALAGAASALLFFQLGFGWAWGLSTLASVTLLALAAIDLEQGLLPDKLTLPLAAAGLIWNAFSGLGAAQGLIGLALCGGLLAAVRLGYRLLGRGEGMGGGDPKLAAALGAWLGSQAGLYAVVAGAGCGALAGVVLIISGRAGWKTALPFGPFLCLGGLVCLILFPPVY